MEFIGKLTLLFGGLILALGWGVAFPQNQDSQQNSQQSSQQSTQQNSQQDAQNNSQQPPPPRENLADMKQKMSGRIQSRIGSMQKALDCIKNAQDAVSLRACVKEARNRSPGGAGMMRGGMGGYN